MTIRGQQIDFDLTAPEDALRYAKAMADMQDKANALPPQPTDFNTPDAMQEYTQWLKAECEILTDFIDGAFGDGTCNSLLGKKTSIAKLNALCEELGDALALQGEQAAKELAPYRPNRRRALEGGGADERQNA